MLGLSLWPSFVWKHKGNLHVCPRKTCTCFLILPYVSRMQWIYTVITVSTQPQYGCRWRITEVFRGAFIFKGSWSLLLNVFQHLGPIAASEHFKILVHSHHCFCKVKKNGAFLDMRLESPTSAWPCFWLQNKKRNRQKSFITLFR